MISQDMSRIRFLQALYDLFQFSCWWFDSPFVDSSGRKEPIESYRIDGAWHLFGIISFMALGGSSRRWLMWDERSYVSKYRA